MDKNTDSITKFELLLQQKTLKKPLSIYKDELNINIGGKTCSSKEVISSVAATLKAIKNSETVRMNKNVRRNLDKYKRNVLLPLTLLDIEYNQPSTSKFDTQCDTDTEFMDICNKVEAVGVDTQNQIVNEFDTSFTKKQHVDDTMYLDTSIEVASQVSGVVCDDLKERNNDLSSHNERKDIAYENKDTTSGHSKSTNVYREHTDVNFGSITSERVDKERNSRINDTDKTLIGFNEEITDINTEENVTDQTYNVEEIMYVDKNTNIITDIIDSMQVRHDRGKHENIGCTDVVEDNGTHGQIKGNNTQEYQEHDNTEDVTAQENHKHDIDIKKDQNNQPNEEEIDINEPPSPILSSSSKKSFHMVCDLTTFEEFEKIMRPVVENESDVLQSQILGTSKPKSRTDSYNEETEIELCSSPILSNELLDDIISSNETAKNELQSQILGNDVKSIKRNEICKDKNEIELSSSPILSNELLDEIISSNETMKNMDTESNNEIKFSSSPLLGQPTHSQSPVIPSIDILIDKEIPITTPDIDLIQDEILFSSDEESDYIHKDIQDLPFTCVLETSFYTNQSDVLDKTMYIDFDREHGTESYMQAKSYFDGIQLSVSELVEKQDRLNVNENDVLGDDKGENPISESRTIDTSVSIDNILNAEINHKNEEEKPFVGFKTASNKNIELSDKSRLRIKQVFQDIDLSDGFVNNEQNANKIFDDIPIDFILESKEREDKKLDDKELEVKGLEDKIELEEFNESKMDIDFYELDRIENVNMKKKKSPVKSLGFTTASNKNIKISETALAITRKVFQDIDLSENLNVADTDDPITEDFNKIGFRTASNKYINVSGKSVDATKNIFQDIDKPSTSKENYLIEDEPKFMGFKTASNKSVEISVKALEQSKKVFQEIDLECDFNEGFRGFETCFDEEVIFKDPIRKSEDLNKALEEGGQKFHGFQTASRKPVTISNEAFLKSKDVFKDIKNMDELKQFATKQEQKFKGFQTASQKPVKISKEAMERTKDMFKDIDKLDEAEKGFKDTEQGFRGFQTANRKPVQISKEAMERTKDIFKDIGDFNKPEQGFKGFQTASKKPVQISEEAIERSKDLFKDIVNSEEPKQINDLEERTMFKGFQTANKKAVPTTKKSLEKTKHLFKDILSLDQTEQSLNKGFIGFQTASKKPVQISKEAMEKTRDIFKNIGDFEESHQSKDEREQFQSNKAINISKKPIKSKDIFKQEHTSEDRNYEKCGFVNEFNEATDINKDRKVNVTNESEQKKRDFKDTNLSPKFGFQTANKKKVQISRSALERTKRIFQNFEDFNIQKEEPIQKSPKFAFKTANNNKIVVTEESKAKSKRLLADIDQSRAFKTDQSESRIDDLINTQVLNNFAENLNTEDFHTPKKDIKRPGSPILSCPKAKKRKLFTTPYNNNNKTIEKKPVFSEPVSASKTIYEFDGSYKKHKCQNMTDILNLEKESTTSIDKTNRYELDSVIDYVFEGERNTISNTKASMKDIKKIFLDSVNKKIVPEAWFENHFKLIVWKLLQYEVQYPTVMKNVCNTKNVLEQLKYRYDKELYRVERPALRKIMEKDELASRTMVLSVASILENNASVASVKDLNSTIELISTDGWYAIKTTIDKMLSKLVYDNKIVVGTKLVINGAELVNCDQGVSPWEDTANIRLKIFGNSTRRAKFSAKLGFHANAAILIPLTAVKMDGGKVSKFRLFVTRVYPLLYVERFEDGSTVTRSERLEQIHQTKYETDRQILMEKIYEEVERKFEQESQDMDIEVGVKRRCKMDTGSQIAKMLKRSKDPIEFRNRLTASQTDQLLDYTNKQRDRIVQEIQSRAGGLARDVAALCKVRVADVRDDGVCCGMLSIWRPNDAILDIIKEGEFIDVLNIFPTALRNTEIQLTAGRQSVFSRTKAKQTDKTKILCKTLLRKCYDIKEIVKNPNLRTDHNEIDTIGIVIEIEPAMESFDRSTNTQNFQNVYLADFDKNQICLNFWGGIKKFGFQNAIDTGQVIYATNLQKRVGNTRKNIPHFRVTELSWFTKTPKNVTARDKVQTLERKLGSCNRKQFIQECIEAKNGINSSKYANENISPYRPNVSDYNLSKNKIYMESPLAKEICLTGLDFESTFKQTDTQGLSPEMIERKKRFNEKMAKLKMYGEPPALSPIHIINKSKKADNDFKSPLNAKSDPLITAAGSCEKIKSDGSSKIESVDSKSDVKTSDAVVTSDGRRENIGEFSKSEGRLKTEHNLDRTYIKRSYMNPVRIDFSDLNSSTDNFAEDFDGSPPLSLD